MASGPDLSRAALLLTLALAGCECGEVDRPAQGAPPPTPSVAESAAEQAEPPSGPPTLETLATLAPIPAVAIGHSPGGGRWAAAEEGRIHLFAGDRELRAFQAPAYRARAAAPLRLDRDGMLYAGPYRVTGGEHLEEAVPPARGAVLRTLHGDGVQLRLLRVDAPSGPTLELALRRGASTQHVELGASRTVALALAPDRLAVGGEPIRVLDLDGELLSEHPRGRYAMRQLAFRGEELLGLDAVGGLHVFATDPPLRFPAHEGAGTALAVGHGLVVSGGEDGVVRVWDPSRWPESPLVPTPGAPPAEPVARFDGPGPVTALDLHPH
ncbi:MAG TPA: WD40 repeat domain-containing protein, partial [Polyangiaceae bacterium LLY-WYZ-15_(1-7)]|nr:WD40 repeat domain-containing protein [Polyangiaceae bacterium LLY-WYZ-15_(1-7)]